MATTASGSGYGISLPKGGGALQALGEKFSPDPHTGTGNFTVPIVLPPGRNGFQPELSLVYSTGAGNGPFWLGWSLSIPGVARKTAKGIPDYDDSRDTFVLSGAEDLWCRCREQQREQPGIAPALRASSLASTTTAGGASPPTTGRSGARTD